VSIRRGAAAGPVFIGGEERFARPMDGDTGAGYNRPRCRPSDRLRPMLAWMKSRIWPRLRVFLSYASEQENQAEAIRLALVQEERDVFFAPRDLSGGQAYHGPIRAEIDRADVFVFLISRESLAIGGYPRAELEMAQARWPNPSGFVLPVSVTDVPVEDLPIYLRSVTVIDGGDRPALVTAAVAALERRRRLWIRRSAKLLAAAAVALALGLIGKPAVSHWVEVRRLRAAADAARDAGKHREAWNRYKQIVSIDPTSSDAHAALEDAGMTWMRDDRPLDDPDDRERIEREVVPVLGSAVAAAKGPRAGDLWAHLGWAEYQKLRADQEAKPVQELFQRALDADPTNPFAHAMWGYFWYERTSLPDEEGQAHFAKALEANRARPAVRALQVSALVPHPFNSSAPLLRESLRVATEMRENREPLSPEERDRLLQAYCSLAAESDGAGLRVAREPQQLVATFRWLASLPGAPPSLCSRFALALLLEETGARTDALAAYREVQDELRAPTTPTWVYNREIAAMLATAIPRLGSQ
jgi:tetratricopeptide (TPR) repeat protein